MTTPLTGKTTMTVAMREVLIEHLDGRRVPVVVFGHDSLAGPALGRRQLTIHALASRALLRFDGSTGRSKYTTITEAGRRVLGVALGDWADALQRARGMMPPDEPVERALRLPVPEAATFPLQGMDSAARR